MRIAILGAGVIGKLRADSVRDNPSTELVAVVDVDLDRARAAAGGGAVVASTDVRSVLADLAPDAVIVSTPPQFHEEQCIAALEAGSHVLCEKPLAASSAACARIVAAADERGRALAVGFNQRFYPSMKYVADRIADGSIGTLDHLRVFGGHDGTGSFRQEWMYRSEFSGGGTMMDVGIHMTDLAGHLAGDIVEVSAIATADVWKIEGSEDNAMAIMRTARGIPILYQATWTEWKRYQIYVEAYGDKGMVRGAYAPMSNLLVTHEKPGAPVTRTRKWYPEIILREKLKGWETTAKLSFDEELADLLKMARGEEVKLADGRAGVHAVRVAEAVYASSAEHRVVRLDEDG